MAEGYLQSSSYSLNSDVQITVDTEIKYQNLFDQAYNLPLYYEGQIKCTSGEAMLYVGQNPDDQTNETSAQWGTGRSDKYYALQIGNLINNGNIEDTSRSMWTKFSLYLDQNEIIFYQNDGIEKYRIKKNAETMSFWRGIAINNNSIKVGTKTWKKAEYKILKVGHSNIWDFDQYRSHTVNEINYLKDGKNNYTCRVMTSGDVICNHNSITPVNQIEIIKNGDGLFDIISGQHSSIKPCYYTLNDSNEVECGNEDEKTQFIFKDGDFTPRNLYARKGSDDLLCQSYRNQKIKCSLDPQTTGSWEAVYRYYY